MPCRDVTESIYLSIDMGNRLLDYELRKRACGAEIGHPALLRDRLAGTDINDIAVLDLADVLTPECAADDELDFAYRKHLSALKLAVAVLRGECPAGPGDACEASRISADDTCIELEGLVRVDVAANKVKACGHCSDRGSGEKLR